MTSSNGGGRKRGRPVTLTTEERREQARLRQAKRRHELAKAQWARLTNSGYMVEIKVKHWLDLVDFLAEHDDDDGGKLLAEKDHKNPVAIEEAVEQLLWWVFEELWEWRQAEKDGTWREYENRLPFYGPPPRWRPRDAYSGKVNFKVTLEVADALKREIEDQDGIKSDLEEILFRLYSDIGELRPPDAYGIPCGSQSYGRGGKAFKEWEPWTPPDPKWTQAEVHALQERQNWLSRMVKQRSVREARDAAEDEAKNEREDQLKKERLANARACVNPIRTTDLLKETPRQRHGRLITPQPDHMRQGGFLHFWNWEPSADLLERASEMVVKEKEQWIKMLLSPEKILPFRGEKKK
jgi:hypothetical protein